jgi:hypothetical protein
VIETDMSNFTKTESGRSLTLGMQALKRIAAAQSSTSFIPPLGEEKAQVLTLNLRNRMIFKGAELRPRT